MTAGFIHKEQLEDTIAMVEAWLEELMESYNRESYDSRESYTAQIHLPGRIFEQLVWWALQALPDEILVGMDIDSGKPHRTEVEDRFRGNEHTDGLVQGQGFVIGEAHIVNRGDSYSVHHLPEDWTDDMFSTSRGSRAGRFTHWLHTHPNAPAIPSNADADAAQETPGVDMILGLRFSPEGPLPWFDDVDGVRRRVGVEAQPEQPKSRKRSFFFRQNLKVLGVAPSGHKIHEIQLIAFRKNGLGINVIMVNEDGFHYGWEALPSS